MHEHQRAREQPARVSGDENPSWQFRPLSQEQGSVEPTVRALRARSLPLAVGGECACSSPRGDSIHGLLSLGLERESRDLLHRGAIQSHSRRESSRVTRRFSAMTSVRRCVRRQLRACSISSVGTEEDSHPANYYELLPVSVTSMIFDHFTQHLLYDGQVEVRECCLRV